MIYEISLNHLFFCWALFIFGGTIASIIAKNEFPVEWAFSQTLFVIVLVSLWGHIHD